MSKEPKLPVPPTLHKDDARGRQRRADRHAAWLKATQADDLTAARIRLVRTYLANPRQYPDGLDWPHWKQPHELWYTGHEKYWADLINKEAAAAQAELDNYDPRARIRAVTIGKKEVAPEKATPSPEPAPKTITTSQDLAKELMRDFLNPPVHNPVHNPVHTPEPVNTPVNTSPKDKRKAYRREWMRKQRQALNPKPKSD